MGTTENNDPTAPRRARRLRPLLTAILVLLVALGASAGVWSMVAHATGWNGLWTTHNRRLGTLTIRIEPKGPGRYLVVPFTPGRSPVPALASASIGIRRPSGVLRLAPGLFGSHATLRLSSDQTQVELVVGGFRGWTVTFTPAPRPSSYKPSLTAMGRGNVLRSLARHGAHS